MWLKVGELANFFVEREKKVLESRFERPTDLFQYLGRLCKLSKV